MVKNGDIKKQIHHNPPAGPEQIDDIFEDFKKIIFPGVTHWQSPKFFAYFPSNSSDPSLLAEFLTAALGIQGMKWITSPAATELEEVVTEWMRQMTGIPEAFSGVIQDTASVSTLCAIIAAREKATGFRSNSKGLENNILRVYCSEEAHSSVEKAVRIAGLGSGNLVKIPVDELGRLLPEKLTEAVENDLKKGYKPACIVAALGTTGLCAIDPVKSMGQLAKKHDIWFHIDAAFAGTALIIPEFRNTIGGLEFADSIVLNPHKWMFTNFDCSLLFVKDKNHLQKTFSLVPEYLNTNDQGANDYSNWGIQLGRRFRSLKLWFVIRNFGVKGIQDRIRKHIDLAAFFADEISKHSDFELIVPRTLSLVCFRWKGNKEMPLTMLNSFNAELLEKINSTGRIYLSHTVFRDKYTLRFVCAQTNTEKKHVLEALDVIFDCAGKLKPREC